MRYCGNCGRSFDPADLAERTCPYCGAAINRTGDLAFDDVWNSARQPTQAPRNQPDPDALSFSASPTAPASGFGIHDPQSLTIATRKRYPFRPFALLALVALALLLVFGSALLLNNAHGRLPLPLGVGGAGADASQATATYLATSSGAVSSPTSGVLSGGALPSPGATLTAGLPTPSASASPNGTPTPTSAPTATPEPGQPALAVSPANVTIGVCLGSTARFTVSNTAAGVMSWSTTGSRAAYKMSPQSGSLDSGQQQTVTVSGISASGSVTFAAPGADGAPQTVTINCTL
jgi:hypothetical protein